MVSTKHLEEGNIPSLILRFSGPAVVGNIVMSIYNVVDRIFIGRGVGPLALAGVTIGFPIMMLVNALAALIGIGATALVSIRLGEKKQDEAEKIMGNAFILMLALAVILGIVGFIFLDPILTMFGASAEVLPYAHTYMSYILLGLVFQITSFGLNSFIRAEGKPHIAMITMIVGAIINCVLDPILIYGFNMGVRGAAIATVASQAVSAIWIVSYFLRGKSMLKIKRKYLKIELPLTLSIINVGLPAFFKQISTSLTVGILNNSLLTYGGDIAISAFGVVHSVMALMLMPIFGISQGIQPIIGYNYGARKFKRVKKAYFSGILLATAVCVTGFLAISFFPAVFIRLFSDNEALLALGVKTMRVHTSLLPVLGFTIIGSNYFQAVGKPRHAVFLNLARQVFLLLPALLILPRFFGLMGVWLATPVADGIASLLTAIAVYFEVRFLNKQSEEQQDEQPGEDQEEKHAHSAALCPDIK